MKHECLEVQHIFFDGNVEKAGSLTSSFHGTCRAELCIQTIAYQRMPGGCLLRRRTLVALRPAIVVESVLFVMPGAKCGEWGADPF